MGLWSKILEFLEELKLLCELIKSKLWENWTKQFVEPTTLLGAGAIYTGISRDCLGYSDFTVSVFTNVAGILYLENSSDGITWRQYDEVGISAGVSMNRVYSVTRRYNRVVYKNGATAQTVFEIVVMLKTTG